MITGKFYKCGKFILHEIQVNSHPYYRTMVDSGHGGTGIDIPDHISQRVNKIPFTQLSQKMCPMLMPDSIGTWTCPEQCFIEHRRCKPGIFADDIAPGIPQGIVKTPPVIERKTIRQIPRFKILNKAGIIPEPETGTQLFSGRYPVNGLHPGSVFRSDQASF